MKNQGTVIAVFEGRQAAEDAVRKLGSTGFDIKHLSVVGKGYHTDEKVVGFYNTGDRIKFWGANGAFWGALWGWLSAGIFVTVPVVGPLVVLGSLAAIVISAVEGAIVFGGLSALGAALFSIGIPKDSIVSYETALTADRFLIMAQGTAEELERAKAVLAAFTPARVDVHHAPVEAKAA
jgi:hypothetical protein